MGSGIKGNWVVCKRDDGTGGNLEVAETMKAKTLVVEETAVLPSVVVDNHVHDASAIISGTIDPERLPTTVSMSETKTITGDGVTSSFPITHELGVKEVSVTVFRFSGARIEVGYVIQSVGNLLVNFADPPEESEEYTVLIQR